MKILIVDDNEDNRVLHETILKAKGHTLECATNGVEALEVAARFCPDMIISDVLMPEMDGFELCRTVKADKRLRNIPFVFYSASYTGSKDKELATALGASRYIVKPMEIEEFVKIIEEVFKEHESGKLTISAQPVLDDKELERMHEKVLVNKLSEKVKELEEEITRRKEVEVKIRKLSQAVEQSSVIVIITDKYGNMEYVNPKFCETTGYTCNEVIGKNPRILKSGDKLPEKYKELWRTITSGNEWKGEFHNKRKNGELYWEYATISPIRNKEGEITHFLGIKEDITKRKQIEEKLYKSEKKYRNLAENMMEIVYTADQETFAATYVNQAVKTLYGYTQKEWLSDNIREKTIHPDDYENIILQVKEAKKDRKDIILEYRIVARDGKIKWVEDRITWRKDNEGNIVEISGIVIDITERKQIEEELRISYISFGHLITFNQLNCTSLKIFFDTD